MCDQVSSSCPKQLPPLQDILGNTGFGTWTMLRKFSSFPRACGSVVWFLRKLRFSYPLMLLMSRMYRYTGKDFYRSIWGICGTSQKCTTWEKVLSAAAHIWMVLLPVSLNKTFSVILLDSSKHGINVNF